MIPCPSHLYISFDFLIIIAKKKHQRKNIWSIKKIAHKNQQNRFLMQKEIQMFRPFYKFLEKRLQEKILEKKL